MKIVQILTIIILFLCSLSSFAQTNKKPDCKLLKHSTLKYLDDVGDTSAYVIINNKEHVEYLRNGKYYIKSKLKWLSDCEYEMTMVEITLPDFPFHAGDMMKVKFDAIEGGVVIFTSNVYGQIIKGRFKIIN